MSTGTDLARTPEKVAQISNPNLLINGDFSVWQRGTFHTFTTESVGFYAPDRWQVNCYGDVGDIEKGVYYSFGDLSNNFNYAIFGMTQHDGNLGLEQRIENGSVVTGKEVTFSCLIRDNDDAIYDLRHGIDSADQWLGQPKTFAVNGWRKLVWTFTCDDAPEIDMNNPPVYAVAIRRTSSGGSAFRIANVKLELGSTATPFIPDDPATNLMKCQRYFYRLVSNACLGTGSANAGNVRYLFNNPVTMRAKPTVTASGNISTRIGSNNISSTSTAASADYSYADWISITTRTNYTTAFTAPYGILEGTISVDAEL